jgi:hypothetical protein
MAQRKPVAPSALAPCIVDHAQNSPACGRVLPPDCYRRGGAFPLLNEGLNLSSGMMFGDLNQR